MTTLTQRENLVVITGNKVRKQFTLRQRKRFSALFRRLAKISQASIR